MSDVDSDKNLPQRCVIDKAPCNSHGKTLIDFLKVSNSCILNGRTPHSASTFTSISCKGAAVVDYCLVPILNISQFDNFKVLEILSLADSFNVNVPCKVPDHSLLSWDLVINGSPITYSQKSKPRSIVFRSMPDSFMESDSAYSKADVLSRHIEDISSQADIDVIYSAFQELVESELVKSVYTKRKKVHKPWWDNSLHSLRKAAKSARCLWLKDKSCSYKKSLYLTAQKAFDIEVNKARSAYFRGQQNDLLSSLRQNPCQFWKRINDLGIDSFRKRANQLPLKVLNKDGNEVYDKPELLRVWKSYFKDLLTIDNSSLASDTPSVSHAHCDSSLLNTPFTMEELEFAFHKANSKSAPGHDGMKFSFLDNTVCSTLLLKLFNKCLEIGISPLVWASSIIKPILKPGGNSIDPSCYRGISLQSCVTKLLCHIMNYRLCDYLESNQLLSEEQNGFRSGRGCADHIFSLHSIVQCRKTQGKDTFAVFIDFRKAFDSVNRDFLWSKVERCFGVDGSFLNLLKSLYKHVSSCVNINDSLSDWFDVDMGVKQGCVLSPVLFSMFIDDLVVDINKTGKGVPLDSDIIASLLYADDVAILAENVSDLQSILNVVDQWCQAWGININPSKSKAIHFRRNKKPITDSILHIGVHTIDFCHEYKYLGYWINEFLNMEESIRKVYDKANRALGVIIAKAKELGGLPFSVFTKLYDVSVLSIFSYIAHIWAFNSSHLPNKIQNNSLRYFFGLGKTAPIAAFLGDSGWSPIDLHLQHIVLKYWHRLGSMPLDRIPKKVFCWCSKYAATGKKNWSFHVKKLLKSVDNESICFDSFRTFSVSVWDALACRHLDAWRRAVNGGDVRDTQSGGKLVWYRRIKTIPKVEPYIRAGLPFGVRRVMAGLRAGCLPLQVELGRFSQPKTPFDNRICKVCNVGVETVQHFLVECKPLSTIRENLFSKVAEINPNFSSFCDSQKCLVLLQPHKNLFSICKLILCICIETNFYIIYLFKKNKKKKKNKKMCSTCKHTIYLLKKKKKKKKKVELYMYMYMYICTQKFFFEHYI